MNKFKKIAALVAGAVMCGSVAMGFVGCGDKTPDTHVTHDDDKKDTPVVQTIETSAQAKAMVTALADNLKISQYVNVKNTAWQAAKDYASNNMTATKTEGKQEKYRVGTDYSGVTLNLNIGDKDNRSISFAFGALIKGTVTLPDGNAYTSSDLKPAWKAYQSLLGSNIKLVDKWANASNKVSTAANSATAGLDQYDIITDGSTNITTYKDKLLDLSNYLDYIPNYKAYLEKNPIVQLSLTSDAQTGAMYYAPYFDGNNDIEKYELFKTNWVQSLLDATAGDTTATFKSSQEAKKNEGTSATVESFMGTTGSYKTDVQDKDGNVISGGIVVNYDDALKAAKDTSSALGAAINEAAGKAYTGESGNIIDLQNFAINETAGAVTGAQLLKITQEYIKVTYQVGGKSFYTQTGYKLSDLFVGNAAAWDVDVFVALGRVMLTNPTLLKSGNQGGTIGSENATALSNLYLICSRKTNTMQRMIDVCSLAGQLYGVRGLESKNIYSYIDADGDLRDVREDAVGYDAFNRLHQLFAEGLITSGPADEGTQSYYDKTGSVEALCTYDYVNTQTPTGYQLEGAVSGKYNLEDGYYYTPVLTPVSKWDEDTSMKIESDEYFRFTESWRTTKDTGFCVPLTTAQDPNKLAAVLHFIDTMFSSDGQITLTYGPKAENADSKGGFWYNPTATAADIAAIDAGKTVTKDGVEYTGYFTYCGETLLSNVSYNGKYQPMLTENTYKSFYGQKVNGYSVNGTDSKDVWGTNATLNYTNYARYVIGSALPLGEKLQSLEFQLTSKMGRDGALVVDNAMNNGIVRHTQNALTATATNVSDYAKGNAFYTVVPTVLPYTDQQIGTLTAEYKDLYNTTKGTPFSNNKDDQTNVYWLIIMNGYSAAAINDKYSALNVTF